VPLPWRGLRSVAVQIAETASSADPDFRVNRLVGLLGRSYEIRSRAACDLCPFIRLSPRLTKGLVARLSFVITVCSLRSLQVAL
jgi:hypothetical protein